LSLLNKCSFTKSQILCLLFSLSTITFEDIFLYISLHWVGITALLLMIGAGEAPDILDIDASSGTLSTIEGGLSIFADDTFSVRSIFILDTVWN